MTTTEPTMKSMVSARSAIFIKNGFSAMVEQRVLRGACNCGTVRFEADRIAWCAHCHCSMCRRAHGAAFVTWAGVKRPDFRLVAGAEALRTYRSSDAAMRRFCGHCGTMLFFEGERWADEVHIARAMLE